VRERKDIMAARKPWKRQFDAVPTKDTSGTVVFGQCNSNGELVEREKAVLMTAYVQKTALPKDVSKHPARIRITIEEIE
jgi:hypothetical protein